MLNLSVRRAELCPWTMWWYSIEIVVGTYLCFIIYEYTSAMELFMLSASFLITASLWFVFQAYVLKYLLFFSDKLGNPEVSDLSYASGQRRFYQSSFARRGDFSSLTEDGKTRWFLLPLNNYADVSVVLWPFICSIFLQNHCASFCDMRLAADMRDKQSEFKPVIFLISIYSKCLWQIAWFTKQNILFQCTIRNSCHLFIEGMLLCANILDKVSTFSCSRPAICTAFHIV